MAVDTSGKRAGASHWTKYAFVSWNARADKWTGAKGMKGPNGKAASKSFSTDKAAAVHVAEQAVLVGYVHSTTLCLPMSSVRAGRYMSPFDVEHWVRCLLCSFCD
jgi:hypothetical protein